MVQKTVRELFDDLDGSPATQTVRFGYEGWQFEIDLNEEHAQELDELPAPYVQHARRVNGAQPRQSRGRRDKGDRRSPQELQAIRQWAREQGLRVSDRGRIAADVIAWP